MNAAIAEELGHPDTQELLSSSMARVAYNGHDGFPRVVPVRSTGPASTSSSPLTPPLTSGVTEEYLESARNSMDGPELEAFERNVRATYQEMVRISIEPLWARFCDFGAGRLPGFVANLVNGGQPGNP